MTDGNRGKGDSLTAPLFFPKKTGEQSGHPHHETAPIKMLELAEIAERGFETRKEFNEAYTSPEAHLSYFGLALEDTDIPPEFQTEPAKTQFLDQYASFVIAELRRQTHAVRERIVHEEHEVDGRELDRAIQSGNFKTHEEAKKYLLRLHIELNLLSKEERARFFKTGETGKPTVGDQEPKIAGEIVEVAFDILGTSTFEYNTDLEYINAVTPGLKLDALRRAEVHIELQEKLYKDSLTGLMNKEGIERRFAAEMSNLERNNAPNDVVFVGRFDLKSFKDINDLLTHSGADELLERIAEELRTQLRETDGIARAGGDEFVIVTTIPKENAAALADKILQAVRSITYTDEGIQKEVGLAGGYYLVQPGDKETTFEAADKLADEISYLAKMGDSEFLEYSEGVYREYNGKLQDPEKQKALLNAIADTTFKRKLEGFKRDKDDENYQRTMGQRDLEYGIQQSFLHRALENSEAPNTGIFGKILKGAKRLTQPLSPVR